MELKGITWNHSRGYVSVVATAQRFMEKHPGMKITWEKRSLQEFADAPIDRLAEQYDLLVIDHPWAGFAAERHILVNLSEHLPAAYLQDQEVHSVGKSYQSYNFDGFQSALAIDAATPVATYRPDLFAREERALPETWEDLLALAKEKKVAFAGIPINALMEFYMLCVTLGEEPCISEDEVVSEETGTRALEMLRELTSAPARRKCSTGIRSPCTKRCPRETTFTTVLLLTDIPITRGRVIPIICCGRRIWFR